MTSYIGSYAVYVSTHLIYVIFVSMILKDIANIYFTTKLSALIYCDALYDVSSIYFGTDN